MREAERMAELERSAPLASASGSAAKLKRGREAGSSTEYSSTEMDVDGGAASQLGKVSSETEAKVMAAIQAHFLPGV